MISNLGCGNSKIDSVPYQRHIGPKLAGLHCIMQLKEITFTKPPENVIRRDNVNIESIIRIKLIYL